jgi:hypothetical protein
MLPIVEPKQSDRDRDREDRKLFKQTENLLFSIGLKDLAKKARDAGDNWLNAEFLGDDADEKLRQSRIALEQLRSLLQDNHARIRERFMVASLPGADDNGDLVDRRKTPTLSALSGPSPSTPAAEIRRHPQSQRPELPADNSAYLGRALFTDYLLPVELGGLLLLVATVGAIAIAQRRQDGGESA